MIDIHKQKILILDFGSQYAQLIARRVRECGVYCELHPFDYPIEKINQLNPNGIILSGGPETVTQLTTPRPDKRIFTLGCPILGICYGLQVMAAELGGQVEPSTKHEYGSADIVLTKKSPLFDTILKTTEKSRVWMSHGDKVTELPKGFESIAKSNNSPIAAMADFKRHFYGLQFHPEVTHTEHGQNMINRFVHDICQCERLWTPEHIVEELVAKIKQKVGNDKVLLGLSGGVDSAVTAALLHKAIGSQLVCVFVDHGLLRLDEGKQVLSLFKEKMSINVVAVEASKQFMTALNGIDDPEEKRKIAGREFIETFQEQASQLGDIKWLAQGTIYPDVIESAAASKDAHVIKSHHNVGGLPEKMHMDLIEPLRELFKDEVRQLGLHLGLPKAMIFRHPFPGPGLLLRILGPVNKNYADTLRLADAIFIEELRKHQLYDKVAQAFAVFLPVKSVGVVGDARQYEYVIALRAVETTDFMTAHWAYLPHDFLGLVANRIVNEVKGISRVVYDITSKPPATIEWE